MNTDNFIIENDDIELAHDICKLITDDNIRNRAVANAIASNIATKYFDKDSFEVDIKSGLHNIGLVLEDIDISDIYIKNNYIDVRVFFSEDGICVPKAHFEKNLLPIAYMFIKINEDLSGASVVGFISPDNINPANDIDGCIQVREDELVSFYDIESLITTQDEIQEIDDKDIFAFIDGTLNNKDEFYAKLLKSYDSRLKLAKATKAKEIFRFISVAKNDETILENESSNFEPSVDSFDDNLLLDEEDSLMLDVTEEGEDLISADGSDEFQDLVDDNEDVELLQEESEDMPLLEDSEEEEEEEEIVNEEIAEYDEISSLDSDDTEIKLEEREVESFDIPESNIETETEELTFVESDNLIVEDVSNEKFEVVEENTPELELEVDSNIVDDNVDDNTSDLEIEEVKDSEFKTMTSHEDSKDILDELSNEPEVDAHIDNTYSKPPIDEKTESNEQIGVLFKNKNEAPAEEEVQTTNFYTPKKTKSSTLPVTLLASTIVIGALGYYGYTKFASQIPMDEEIGNNDLSSNVVIDKPVQKQDAMPVESLETAVPLASNEGIAETIPAIEQNLDASILVSNLKVEWEIPAGYASNTSARRYLIKIGKIIQLNLKTELLLLNKPPITNKIAVEIKYNDHSKKFETAGIKVSSGEKSVDTLIRQAVDKALGMNLSINTNSFAKLQGNPVLIIHL